ncbi:uncharacterized protein LOC132301505 [Cornus florida]|uniref:uncharacterized protein LOC132301505 n=1 Tax=Cornus florida TaxID=4283 RepID=UPI00289E3D3D|nr:uncharacterized protein LOC132301505 [Cornus florida]
MTFKHHQDSVTGDLILSSPEIEHAGISALRSSLIGFFVHKSLHFGLIQTLSTKYWSDKGLLKVTSSVKGFFEFHFSSSAMCDLILAEGPWFFAGKAITLKKWDPEFRYNHHVSSLPIWVKIFGLPLHYWTSSGFSLVVSAIGKPIFANIYTEEKSKTRFVKLCIEINTNSHFPATLNLQLNSGIMASLRFEYLHCPPSCSLCQCFGHNLQTCPSSPSKTPTHSLHNPNDWQIVPFSRNSHENHTLLTQPPQPATLKNTVTHFFSDNDKLVINFTPLRPLATYDATYKALIIKDTTSIPNPFSPLSDTEESTSGSEPTTTLPTPSDPSSSLHKPQTPKKKKEEIHEPISTKQRDHPPMWKAL